MTPFWNVVVTSLVLLNIAACVWLLIWTAKRRPDEVAQGEETGHVWDDDLREYNNPLPRWWLNLFVLTVIFGLAYLALYPGLGNFAGRLGWSSAQQHDQRLAAVDAKRHAIYAAFDRREVADLRVDRSAQALGAKLFESNCAGCHGTDARGAKGFPNLADADWLYGGAPEQVYTSITNGRNGQMPPFFGALEEAQLKALMALVREWPRANRDPAEHLTGLQKFNATCAACHGPDGKGNALIGAPNLTDNVWLHGAAADDLRQTILFGRQSEMPAFRDTLGETERRLLSAYVLSLSDRSVAGLPAVQP
jgi:cytochrome c oxidase cbb3-type subunit 3